MPTGRYGDPSSSDSRNSFTSFPLFRVVAAVVGLVVGMVVLGKSFEHVGAQEIMVVQDPWDGELHWYTSQGVKVQKFGTITKYPRRSIYEFKCTEYKDGDKRECAEGAADRRLTIRFNDGGHGKVDGSIQYEMPLDVPHLTELHKKFGSPEAIQRQLIETVVNKSVYMTGPLMSSKESYADRRNDLIRYVEDQVENGVYQTRARETKEKDPLSGVEKTVRVVEIVVDSKTGMFGRQEAAQLTKFGVKPLNFSIDRLPYDLTVEKQITQQQQITMDVQTAIAEARKAEQRKLTVEQQGAADAAKAKWDQEVVKAKEVTAAEQRLRVAELDRAAAEQTKQKNILEGQGEAEKRRLVMQADGALEKKLDAYVKVNELYAAALKDIRVPLVPTVQTGGSTSGNLNPVQQLMELIQVRTARDLALDVTPGKQ